MSRPEAPKMSETTTDSLICASSSSFSTRFFSAVRAATGEATAGVKRQYLGCAGRVANGINTVHLSYVREKTGHALIGARQWIPREQIEDPARSLLMGLPPDLAFRTKGQLAI